MDNRLAFPLGFKIVKTTGSDNTGHAIDERMVMDEVGTDFLKFDAAANIPFYHEGMLSYIIGKEYHGSGVTSDAGFYYRDSADAWVGFNADTIDDKHADGTMDSTSNATSDPTTGTNIVDHVNYLYTVTSALASGQSWLAPVTLFADLATTYPTPSTGDSALVTSENSIYTYNGSVWVKTYGNVPLVTSSVSGIVSYSWYTPLHNFVTTPSNYLNQNAFSSLILQQNSAGVGTITAGSTSSSFTINAGSGLNASYSGSTITLSTVSVGDSIVHNDNIWTSLSEISESYSTDDIFENVFLGYRSGLASTIANDNIYIGTEAGRYFTEASSNVCIGYYAGRGTTNRSANSNVIIGFSAGYNCTNDNNIYIGTGAGFDNEDGEKNIFIGNSAGSTETGSNRLYISYSSGDPLIYGEFDNRFLKIGGSLEVETIKITTSPTNGYVFTSDASGNGSWQAAPSGTTYTSSNGITESTGDFKLGGTLTENTTIDGGISYDVTINSDNLLLSSNTSITLTVSGNVPAIYGNTVDVTTDNHIPNKKYVDDSIAAIVIPAGGDTIVHDTNNIWTSLSGLTSVTGEANVLLGLNAGTSLTTGESNVFIGSGTGDSTTSGIRNIFLGLNAGNNNTTGSNSIFIGISAGSNVTTGSDNIVIGQTTLTTTDSNILAIDNGYNTDPLVYGEFDNQLFKINGNLEATTSSVSNGTVKWKFEIDGVDDTKLHLKFFDGASWNIVTTFDAN